MSDFVVWYTVVTVAQFVLAVLLFTMGLPRRDNWPARLAALCVSVAAVTALGLQLGFAFFPTLTDLGSFVRAIGSFALVFVTLCGAVLLLFDVSATSSLYYASSAYLLQTFASTLHRLLLGAGVGGTGAAPQVGDLNAAFVALVTAVSYGAAYLGIVQRLRRRVVEVPQTPAMVFSLVMSLAVSLVFDLLVKDVTPGLPAHYAVFITCFSLAICAFVLVAEYEITLLDQD